MGHIGQKCRFGTIGSFCILTGFFQTLHVFHSLRQITYDNNITDDIVVTVNNFVYGQIAVDIIG